jgi:AraC-like DNA-binding protein
MIKYLNGIKETVEFESFPNILLYDNNENEIYPKHWHTPIEIIMPIHGGYKVMINKDSEFVLKNKDIIIITPGTVHSVGLLEDIGERIIFQMDFSVLRQIKEIESTLSIIAPAFMISNDKFPTTHNRALSIIYDIKNEYEYGGPLSEASIMAKVIELFVLIGREYAHNQDFAAVSEDKQREYTEKFMNVCNFINLHCTEDVSLEQISELAGFSKFHFSRLFKQFTGIPFYRYLNQRKISVAESLLIDPANTITDVAIRSGFSSFSTFNRMFRIIKECTPSEFRNMHSSPRKSKQ